MTRIPLALTSVLMLTITLAACDGGGSGDDNDNGGAQPGTFSASVDGDLTTSFSGMAVSTGFAGTWGIVLAPGQMQTIALTTQGVGRPAAGTYVIRRNDLGNPVQVGEFFGSVVLETERSWFVRQGTLTLTSSTPSSVAGTFVFTVDRSVGDAQEATVRGSFNATNTGG